jgi:chaperonin cofactor prefoldin
VTYQPRMEEAERRATALMKQVTDLEKNRVAHETMKRVTTDAADLKALAKRLSERTELIEGQLKTQLKKSDKTTADLETTRTELKAALQNAMALSKELAAAKEQAHAFETKAIKATADAKRHQEALAPLKNRVAALEADDRASQAEITELRAELAEAWSATGSRFSGKQHQPTAVVVHATSDEQPSAAGLPALAPAENRHVDDLRFERMHVEQLERRLGSWMGLASAALRKVTRLGRKPTRVKSSRKRIAGPATSAT